VSGLRSRRKGIGWEREVVRTFAEVFGAEHVRRGFQFRDGAEAPDVHTPIFAIECKRGARTNPRAALAQIVKATDGKGFVPIAVCRDDHEEPFVVMRLDDLTELARELWQARQR
jgi:hypothetical protein